MDNFSVFFERKIRNPLRKKELEDSGSINNKEWVDKESKKLNSDERRELKNLKRRVNTTPDQIDSYKKNIEHKKKDILSKNYLKGKTFEDLNLVKRVGKIRIYVDQYVDNSKQSKESVSKTVKMLLFYYKDIIPIRGFDIVITNSKNNPNFYKNGPDGGIDNVAAYYNSNKIYIDEQETRDSKLLLHEYAHLLADRVSKQVEPILKREYEKMINSFISGITGKRSRMKKLEGVKHKEIRKKIARELQIPDPYENGYAVTNFDEWFAVIIENWKYIPNNVHTYRFKSIMKKIINRL